MVARASDRGRIDFAAVAESADLPALLAEDGVKVRGGKVVCPYHDDHDPSLSLYHRGGRWWFKCHVCGAAGDSISYVARRDGIGRLEAARRLAGDGDPIPRPRPCPAPRPEPAAPATAGWSVAVGALVEEAERRLWGPAGAEALAYLHRRGLRDEVIRAARLGLSDGRGGAPSGITIPWRDGGLFTMVNVRRPAGAEPKYRAVRGSRRGGIYPDHRAIVPGRPLIVCEGELDALLMAQELGVRAAVVTLGGASSRPDPAALSAMLGASPWYIATDADPAGDRAAGGWPARARRVRPPGSFKDWTELHLHGVDLGRWWGDVLAGNPSPPLFTWPELAAWRWGGTDATPGIQIER
jgi:hypothetical protein